MAGVTIILLCIYVANCFCQNTFLVSFNEYLFNQCQCIEQTWWSFKGILAKIDPLAPFATRSLVLYRYFLIYFANLPRLGFVGQGIEKKILFQSKSVHATNWRDFFPSFFIPKIPEKRCAKLWHNGAKSRDEIFWDLFWSFPLVTKEKSTLNIRFSLYQGVKINQVI